MNLFFLSDKEDFFINKKKYSREENTVPVLISRWIKNKNKLKQKQKRKTFRLIIVKGHNISNETSSNRKQSRRTRNVESKYWLAYLSESIWCRMGKYHCKHAKWNKCKYAFPLHKQTNIRIQKHTHMNARNWKRKRQTVAFRILHVIVVILLLLLLFLCFFLFNSAFTLVYAYS